MLGQRGITMTSQFEYNMKYIGEQQISRYYYNILL